MKHILNNISQEEKQTILEQHSGGKIIDTSSFKRLLESKLGDVKPLVMEQVTGDTQTAGGGGKALKNKEYVNDSLFPVNVFYDSKGVLANFDPATGKGSYTGNDHKHTGKKLSYTVTCKCDTGDGSIIETKFNGAEGFTNDQLKNVKSDGSIAKWYTERCKIYLQGKCGPVLATRAELDNVWKNFSAGQLDPSDRSAICKFVKAQQGYTNEFIGYNEKMKQVLGDIKHFKPGTDQKTFDNSDYADKGRLFCSGWGL